MKLNFRSGYSIYWFPNNSDWVISYERWTLKVSNEETTLSTHFGLSSSRSMSWIHSGLNSTLSIPQCMCQKFSISYLYLCMLVSQAIALFRDTLVWLSVLVNRRQCLIVYLEPLWRRSKFVQHLLHSTHRWCRIHRKRGYDAMRGYAF